LPPEADARVGVSGRPFIVVVESSYCTCVMQHAEQTTKIVFSVLLPFYLLELMQLTLSLALYCEITTVVAGNRQILH
jgi:hypothetical protein